VRGALQAVWAFSGTWVIAEYQNGAAPSAPTREYIYTGAGLLAKIESGAVQYYHRDHLSVRLMTRSTHHARSGHARSTRCDRPPWRAGPPRGQAQGRPTPLGT
jgi:hypothetical protein